MGWLSWLRGGTHRDRKHGTIGSFGVLPTVRFDPDLVSGDVERMVRDMIAGESDIPAAKRRGASRAALASIRHGRDAANLTGWLLNEIEGLPKASAQRIARTIHNRATVMMRLARELKQGLEVGIWMHSGAPCYPLAGGGTVAGKEASATAHKRLSGQRFNLVEGALIDGERCWPGWDERCMCTWRPVIPGFD